jgi:hypothetical protein
MLSNKDYRVLHINPFGYVIQCQLCDHFQVAFGTSLLIFTQKELHDFWQDARQQISYCGTIDNPHLKQFQLSTACAKIILIFSFRELQDLEHLLEEAHLCLEVQFLISNINTN